MLFSSFSLFTVNALCLRYHEAMYYVESSEMKNTNLPGADLRRTEPLS
jgi:hypothetical protein